ncbi:ribosome small subunit-dependent GTPase A [Streptomyces sp. NPDC004232]|uniref:ribosome small subunit-dependent GTPase A n=1 Tax=unclassified Streptomyces TaxID=2593676 RepID=UPI001D28EA5A|nr:ribosome small subunit-dependent GTPase A [Streptomyces sp. tea 10]
MTPEPEELTPLGWDEGFAESWTTALEDLDPRWRDLARPARVVRVDRGVCTVLDGAGEQRARVSLPPALRQSAEGQPAVGDWAAVVPPETGDELAGLVGLLPRRSAFTRRAAGRETVEQVVASNIDVVFIVVPLTGRQRLRTIERYLAVAWQSGAQPVIVLTKADLCPDVAEAVQEVESVAFGVPVVPLSVRHEEGVEALYDHLQPGRTVSLVGASGVGKSTLVNHLYGQDRQATREIRSDGKGRHTTTHRELVPMPDGALLIDTPGMRALGAWDIEEGLQQAFGDVEQLAGECRFGDCRHQGEPGCAVNAAVDAGDLSGDRVANWEKLQREQQRLELQQDSRARADEHKRVRARQRALNRRPHR